MSRRKYKQQALRERDVPIVTRTFNKSLETIPEAGRYFSVEMFVSERHFHRRRSYHRPYRRGRILKIIKEQHLKR